MVNAKATVSGWNVVCWLLRAIATILFITAVTKHEWNILLVAYISLSLSWFLLQQKVQTKGW